MALVKKFRDSSFIRTEPIGRRAYHGRISHPGDFLLYYFEELFKRVRESTTKITEHEFLEGSLKAYCY